MVKQEKDIEATNGQLLRSFPDPVLFDHQSSTPYIQLRSRPSGGTRIWKTSDRNTSSPFSESEEVAGKIYRIPEEPISKPNLEGGTIGRKADRISIVGVKELNTTKSKGAENSKRSLPSVGAYTVQCAQCLKWRLIPTKEQYEEIRQCILEEPWVCQHASSWRPNAACDEPTDLSQDFTRLWAIDKPNIPRAPPGWERLTVIRGAGSVKFADIYYVEPSGKKLRSIPDVERFLAEHSEYTEAGININQFSFITPRPLDEHYVRKKPSTEIVSQNTSSNLGVRRPLFKPTSAKKRAEGMVARRKSLLEILKGGQSQEQQEMEHEKTVSDSILHGMETCTDMTTYRTSQGEVPNGPVEPGSLAVIPFQPSVCLPISQPCTDSAYQLDHMQSTYKY